MAEHVLQSVAFRKNWLSAEIEKDAKGFARTAPALAQSPHGSARRQPFLLERFTAETHTGYNTYGGPSVRRCTHARLLERPAGADCRRRPTR